MKELKEQVGKRISIKDIVIDKEYYPRRNWDWFTVMIYAKSIKADVNNKFPPLKVAEVEGVKGYVLIDGWHRLKAYLSNKIEKVDCIIYRGYSKKELYLEAVKSNLTHGKSYNVGDKIKIITDLRKFNINASEISKLVLIPEQDIDKLVKGRVTYDLKGNTVILKPILKGISNSKIADSEEFEAMQHSFGGAGSTYDDDGARSQAFLLQQVITMLEQDLFIMDNSKVMEKLISLKSLLKEKIK